LPLFRKWISGIFIPLGFGTWQAAVALLTGLVAKESVVSTISVLYTGAESSLTAALMQVFTPLSAYAFMAFTLLYMPCISAFAAIRREMNSLKWALATALYQTGVAYVVALIIFQCGSFIIKLG
jgi:ferrous iron transport protein B